MLIKKFRWWLAVPVMIIILIIARYSIWAQGSEIIVQHTNPISFVLYDNRIFVETIILGRKCMLVLDTGGNSPTILDEQLARELKLTLVPGMPVFGAGSKSMKSYRTRVDTIAFGGIRLIDQPVVVTSFREIREALNLQFLDGIISSELFYKFTVTIDFSKNQLVLNNASSYQAASGSVRVPFQLMSDMPLVEAVVEGIPGYVVVDTGDRSNFTLFKHFAQQNDFFIRPDLEDTVITGYGLGGPIMGRFFKLKNLKVGGWELANIRSRIPTVGGGAFDRSDDIIGSIGNGLLANFQSVTFDYKRKSMDIIK